MNTTALELMEQTVTELRADGRVSPAVGSFARRVGDWCRGVVPTDQWHLLHQEIVAYGRGLDAAREQQPARPTSDTDRRVSALLCKTLNGDTHGMLQDLARLLLEAYRDAHAPTRPASGGHAESGTS